MKVVLDTNVVVSGLLSPFGPAAELLRLVAAGRLMLCYDARLLEEYREVLLRPRFGFDPREVHALLEQMRAGGVRVETSPLPERLPDPDDEPFLEVALNGEADALVTGNTKHYPARSRQNVTVLSPRQFLDVYREHGAGRPPG